MRVRDHRSRRRGQVLLGLLVVALLVIPSAGAAAWSYYQQPTTYAVEVDLLHEPGDATSAEDVDRQLATHQVLMLGRPLVEDAASSVGRDAQALARDASVRIVDASSVLRLRVVDRDADRARRTADFLADRYVSISSGLASESDIGRVSTVIPPAVLDDPVGPQPVRAAAAGLLVGLVLTVALMALLRFRGSGNRRPEP
ncbi:hypothetical protein [Candidatus Blastococcus massiliensis]|uniref:hypothetical protein n=1 Tax=Candidatus Blastococcus massiliensis TaxID=1470358 RepID=UPI001AA1AF5B|nr:hypothetical protein [Candidatus Blastococcus massiliensis]